MGRLRKDLLLGSRFHHRPATEHRELVAQVADQAQIVGDDDDAAANDQRWRVTLMCRSKAPSPKKFRRGNPNPAIAT
jgi:hypothetical protein